MIEIKDIWFSYGDNTVLQNISMTLKEGCIYGLLGENGVGKTTLLTLMCGLKKPKMGTITTDGSTPFDREPDFLAQQYYLGDELAAPNMKASDFALNYGKFREHFCMETFSQIMESFETDINQKMNSMSCGQLKKTHIAFALACRTKYLFMDEPTNGLDIPSKAQFRKAVTKYTREDATIVISTHQVRDLENIIDPIIILDSKEVLMNASLEDISRQFFFDYSNTPRPDALYSEMTPGGCIQVCLNTSDQESKVNIEALFNTVHRHKSILKR